MKTTDKIIEEIRESRCRISEKFGNDPEKCIDYLKTFNQKYSKQIQRYKQEQVFNGEILKAKG